MATAKRSAATDHLLTAVPWAALAAAFAIWASAPPVLEELQLRVFDAFQRLRPRVYQPAPVRILDVDEPSLRRLGQWPWPRTHIARLVDELTRLGAAAIAFDVVFSEPDRTSPANLVWPPGPALDAIQPYLGSLPDHDTILAASLATAPAITGFSMINETTPQAPRRVAGLAYAGPAPEPMLPGFDGAVRSLPILESSAAGNGHLTIVPDRDGIVRRVPLFLTMNGTAYPSLMAEALRVAQGASSYTIKTAGGSGERAAGSQGIVSVKIGSLVIPTDAAGRMWLRDTGPLPQRVIPAWRVFEQQVAPEDVAGQIVFIGTSAAGLKDLRATPVYPAAAGVEVHAQLAEQALRGVFLRRPDWARGAEAVYLLLLGAGLIVLLPKLGGVWSGLGGAAVAAGVWAMSWTAFINAGWLLDPVGPTLLLLVLYLLCSTLGFLKAEGERRQIRQAFSRYLSPEVVERLARDPRQLRLGGETRVMTVLFSDIRGFTAIAERFDAQGLTQFMNRYLTPMTAIILENRGTIDKYIGDCIMAFWNAPLDDPEHAKHAAEAALAMRQHLVDWNREFYEEHKAKGTQFAPVHIGIGLNTGQCVVGNFGSEQRFDYSVLGDSVNLASRLESQAKQYGVDVILGEETSAAIADHALIELDLITVSGKTKPSRVFALLGNAAVSKEESYRRLRSQHDLLLKAYRSQRWDEAMDLVGECRALDTEQTRLRALYKVYADRINAYRVSPPGPNWNGVFTATSK